MITQHTHTHTHTHTHRSFHTLTSAVFEKQPPDNMRKSNFFHFMIHLIDENQAPIEVERAVFKDFHDFCAVRTVPCVPCCDVCDVCVCDVCVCVCVCVVCSGIDATLHCWIHTIDYLVIGAIKLL